jgi:hypothetical protein
MQTDLAAEKIVKVINDAGETLAGIKRRSLLLNESYAIAAEIAIYTEKITALESKHLKLINEIKEITNRIELLNKESN